MDLATRILIVDDDVGIREVIASFLEKHGFATSVAGDPQEMRAILERQRHDLIVLDVMMPGEDGLTALRRLNEGDAPPVIMLSAVGSDVDRIIGLEVGADDYLAKPCNPRELLARIRTVLRRRERDAKSPARPDVHAAGLSLVGGGPMLRFAGWTLDVLGHLLYDPDGRLVTLTDGELRLLRALAERPRRVLTRDQLLDFARGEGSESYDRAIDVQISRIRRKMHAAYAGEELIRTVRNEGYMFMAAAAVS